MISATDSLARDLPLSPLATPQIAPPDSQSAPQKVSERSDASVRALGTALDEALPALSRRDAERLQALRKHDERVRMTEAEQARRAGPYAGAARYTYEIGPDGKRYAIDGGAALDASPAPGNPAATIHKLEMVRDAALTEMPPSVEDHRIAAEAGRLLARAEQELRENEDAAAPSEQARHAYDAEAAPADGHSASGVA